MSVNVKIIDDQHKKFLELCNRTYEYVTDRRPESALNESLNQLLDYTKSHFATEEKYFDEFNYEDSLSHKEEHIKLINQTKDLIMKRQQNPDLYATAFELLDFLEDWLVHHLKNVDKKYSKCFNEHGLY